MFIKAALLSAIATLLLVPAANAGKTPGLAIKMHGQAVGETVRFTVKLSTNSARPGTVATVMFATCKFGQQTPLALAHRTRHLDGESENLLVNKLGNLEWSMTRVPALGSKPRVLTLVFALPQGKGGPFFCVRASALAWATGDRVALDLKVPLK